LVALKPPLHPSIFRSSLFMRGSCDGCRGCSACVCSWCGSLGSSGLRELILKSRLWNARKVVRPVDRHIARSRHT
jgi:hypothetical protein